MKTLRYSFIALMIISGIFFGAGFAQAVPCINSPCEIPSDPPDVVPQPSLCDAWAVNLRVEYHSRFLWIPGYYTGSFIGNSWCYTTQLLTVHLQAVEGNGDAGGGYCGAGTCAVGTINNPPAQANDLGGSSECFFGKSQGSYASSEQDTYPNNDSILYCTDP